MVGSFKIIDHVSLLAPLGLRFWDEVTGKAIGDGLSIEAYPSAQAHRKIPAFVNNSSVYILRNLPGLKSLENGFQEKEFLDGTFPKRPFVVEVEDREGRFQPFQFTVQVPARGIFVGEDLLAESPPLRPLGIPLFSTAARAVPAAMAVVRADLLDTQNGAPAAWAILEARLDARLIARGMADNQGRVALIFPYPDLQSSALVSPPDATLVSPPFAGPALKEQRWIIELKAFYQPQNPVPTKPDLQAVLTQPPATIWKRQNTVEFEEATLTFGRELILKSESITSSALLVTPLRSPP
jgi:hypothetical protein